MADVEAVVATAAETKIATFALALVVGMGLGAMISPNPVALPAVGSVSSLYLGGAAVAVAGGGLLARDRLSSSDCGCGGDCCC